jgi:hypothetical protein
MAAKQTAKGKHDLHGSGSHENNPGKDQPVPDATASEKLKLEISIHLEEYKALRSEIVATLSASQLTTSLTLTAAGILIAGAPFIIQYRAAYLFLLASYGFYLIAWMQLHYVNVVFHISEHISTVIAPRIRTLLTKVAPAAGETYPHLLSWEDAGRASDFWAAPLQWARYLFPICAASASAIGFSVNASQLGNAEWQPYSLNIGAISTIVLLAYTIFLTLKVRVLTRRYAKSPRR